MYLQYEEHLHESVKLPSSLPSDLSWVDYQPQPETLELFF